MNACSSCVPARQPTGAHCQSHSSVCWVTAPGTTAPRGNAPLGSTLSMPPAEGWDGYGKEPKGVFATLCECLCGNARFGKGGCICPAGEDVGCSWAQVGMVRA